ncbi:hypothetical protein BDZ45DRAFT_262099 [Acephala macrosclerotiorum]|nr:hypothetical protein BDZ45DRAFT_262099 [Acephala macrosclerotiorum]
MAPWPGAHDYMIAIVCAIRTGMSSRVVGCMRKVQEMGTRESAKKSVTMPGTGRLVAPSVEKLLITTTPRSLVAPPYLPAITRDYLSMFFTPCTEMHFALSTTNPSCVA